MLENAVLISASLIAISMMLNVWRMIIGPSAPDRIIAVDTLYVNGVALIILLGVFLQTRAFIDAAMIIALMGYVSTVALAKYLLRGKIFN